MIPSYPLIDEIRNETKKSIIKIKNETKEIIEKRKEEKEKTLKFIKQNYNQYYDEVVELIKQAAKNGRSYVDLEMLNYEFTHKNENNIPYNLATSIIDYTFSILKKKGFDCKAKPYRISW